MALECTALLAVHNFSMPEAQKLRYMVPKQNCVHIEATFCLGTSRTEAQKHNGALGRMQLTLLNGNLL